MLYHLCQQFARQVVDVCRKRIQQEPISDDVFDLDVMQGKDESKQAKKLSHLAISVRQQKHDYSCVAAVTEMVYGFYTDGQLSHEEAIKLTGCEPDGAELITVAEIMQSLCGATHRNLRSLVAAKQELKRGVLVVSNDERSYADPHAVLFCGATKAGVYVCDPNTARISWRSDRWIKQSGATELIAIFPPADVKTRRKPAGKRQKSCRNRA